MQYIKGRDVSLERHHFQSNNFFSNRKLLKPSSLRLHNLISQKSSSTSSQSLKCDSPLTSLSSSLSSPAPWLPHCPTLSMSPVCVMLTIESLRVNQRHFRKLSQLNWKHESATAKAASPAKPIKQMSDGQVARLQTYHSPIAMLTLVFYFSWKVYHYWCVVIPRELDVVLYDRSLGWGCISRPPGMIEVEIIQKHSI